MSHDPRTDLDALLQEEPYVRALARVLCAGHADEIVQQTWLHAWEHRGERVDRPRAWLGTIVRNVTRNLLRRESRNRRREQAVAELGVAPSSVELMQREERRRKLVELVDALPAQQREVMLLRYFDGMPPRDIARRLGLPSTTVWNLHRRALERLRHALDAAAGEDGSSRAVFLLPLLGGASWTSTPIPPALAEPVAGATPSVATGALAGSLAIATTMKTKLLAVTAVLAAIALAVYWPDIEATAPTAERTAAAGEADPATADLSARRLGGAMTTASDGERQAAVADAERSASTGALEVRVRFGGDDPQPARDAIVTYRRARSDFRLAPRVRTDASGFARIDGLEPGGWIVHDDRHSRGRRVEIESGKVAKVELTYPRGMQLRGVVVDAAGQPVAGASIETAMPMVVGRDPQVLAVSDDAGRFEIRDAFRPCCVAARATGFLAPKPQMVYVAPGADADVRIVLQRGGGTVDGVVVDEQGQPIANALVCIGEGASQGVRGGPLGDSEPLPALVRTDGEGTFCARSVPAGEAPVWARAADRAPWRGTCAVAAFGTTGLRITMQRGGVLRGTVREPDGTPVADAEVVHADWQQFDHVQTLSDDAGAFELRGLPLGAVEVRAEHDDAGRCVTVVQLASGQVVARDLVLSRGLVLRGRVTDRSGEPVARVSVDATAERTPRHPHWRGYTRTDAAGNYAIPNCPVARPIRVAFAGEAIEPHVAVDVDPQKGPVDVVVERAGSTSITGRVVGPDGAPLAGVRVAPRCERRSQHLTPFTTTADGRFRFGPIPAGVWRVAFDHDRHPSRTIESPALDDAGWNLGDVALELGGSAVIQPRTVAGTDLHYMVAATASGERWSLLPAAQPVTPILRPGDYLMQVWGERAAAQVVRFTILAGQRIEVPLHTEVGHRQRLAFAYDRDHEAPDGATLQVYRGADKVVDRWLSPEPGEQWRHDLWLSPGTYRVTMSGRLRGEATLTIGDREPPLRTITLRRR